MSTWTHIAGAISADDVGSLVTRTDPASKAKKVIGKWKDEWREVFKGDRYLPNAIENFDGEYGSGEDLPHGSEGSMRYVAQNIGRENSANNLVITFFGNLRDYDIDNIENELIPWFEELLPRLRANHISPRNAGIQIQCENTCFSLMLDMSDYKNPKFIKQKTELK